MKFFTRDLIERYGSEDDAIAHAAAAEVERVNESYGRHLKEIEPELPKNIREFNDLLLHDAVVWHMARHEDKFLMVLHKDMPPHDLVFLTYLLAGEPVINKEALSPPFRSQVMDFQYDELDLIEEGNQKVFVQNIVFGVGWELELRFRDVQVIVANPVYCLPDAGRAPGSPFMPKSA